MAWVLLFPGQYKSVEAGGLYNIPGIRAHVQYVRKRDGGVGAFVRGSSERECGYVCVVSRKYCRSKAPWMYKYVNTWIYHHGILLVMDL